jgi:UDP-perosamine 4-acetyltransferase
MTDEIVVIGASGHAKVCIESLQAMGETIATCVATHGSPSQCLGIPVLLGDEHLESLRARGYHRAFVALGNNNLRVKLAEYAVQIGFELVNAINPSSVVSASARLGTGIAIMAGAIVNADAQLGDLSIVNTGATVDHDCLIGRGAHIAPQVALAGGVDVGALAFVGIGARVVPDRCIGTRAIVGAGGVVIHDVGAGVTVAGVPARPIPLQTRE